MRLAAFTVLVVAFGGASTAVAATPQEGPKPPLRHNMDLQAVDRLGRETPSAAELYAAAEAKLERAEYAAAEALLSKARAQAPTSGIVARRYCQVLTELGKRDEAIAACKQAIIYGRNPLDERAAVGAVMLGENPPTPADVALALQLARSVKRLSDQPFGDGALCEIAHRLGDAGMLKQCITELQRVAPDHLETRRWAAAQRPPAGWPYWLGWGALAFAGLATALHALRAGRSRRAARGAVVTACLGLFLAARVTPAAAQEKPPEPAATIESFPADKPPADRGDSHWQLSTAFPFNPKDPEASVPTMEARNKNPLQFGYYLQDLASEAAYAEKRNDPQVALKFWRTLAKAVPDVAIGFRKSCRIYEKLNDRERALEFCAAAITREGTMVEDYEHYGQLLLSKPKPLDPVELADIEATIQHLRESKDGQPDAGWIGERFACEVGVRLNDPKRLERCLKVLSVHRKDEQTTLYYQWSLAILNKNYPEARRLFAALKKTKLRAEALAMIEYKTQEGDWWRKPLRDWRYAVALAALLAIAGAVLWLRRRPGGGGPAPTGPGPAPAPAA